ncbi:MAG: RagB/SusD family nutrient uptake outer membrane protein [Prevotellaceae bacterium]|jgi:hypothetical protein|nr:RagB/SusD family nutrient uptake outer membrane protein [Prevotellaceae bacterium]
MKKLLYSSSIALMGLGACSESFLDVYPPTSRMSVDFYQTEADLIQGLISAYDPLQWDSYVWGQYNQITMISDMMGDDIATAGGGNEFDQERLTLLHRFSITPLMQPDGLWTIYYSGVNRTLHVIENANKIEGISEANKNRILGEAKFLFAYYYHWMWKLWGNIPYYDKNLVTPYTAPQLPADEVYAKLVAIMDEIIKGDYLPVSVPDGELGRITRAAAQMLKARIVMYQKDATRYAEVLADMENIQTQGYALYDDFEKMFTDDGEFCEESIFEVNYWDKSASRTWDYTNGVGGTVFPKFIGPRGLKNSPVFQEGWGFEPVKKEAYDLFSSDDQRKDATILNIDKHIAENPGVEYTPGYGNTGYFNKKYAPRAGYNDVTTGNTDMNFRNNIRIFRYAETLLNIAELRLRLGTGDAQTPYDDVRRRALGDAFAQQTVTLDLILHERRLEFMLEGHRYWDLQRFDKAETALADKGYAAFKKYWPIPSAEIDRTSGMQDELKPNPWK